MSRRLFNFAAGISLAFCMAVGVVFVRIYFASDVLAWYRQSASEGESRRWVGSINSGRGAVAVTSLTRVMSTRGTNGTTRVPLWARGDPKRALHWEPQPYPLRPVAPPEYSGIRAGFFEFVSHSNTSRSGATASHGRAVTVSCWVLILVTALLPTVWLAQLPGRRLRERRRVR